MKITVQLIETRKDKTWEARCGLRLGVGETQVEALGRLVYSLAQVDDVELVQLEALDLRKRRKAVPA